MNKKNFRLKKSITELVDDALSLIKGDNKDYVNQNVRSAKTLDSRIQSTTQNWSWNRRAGLGSEYFSDASFFVSESDDKLKEENNNNPKDERIRRHELWVKTAHNAIKLANEKFPKGEYPHNENIPKVLIDLLKNFNSIKFEKGFFWYDNEMMTNDEAWENIEHTLEYYLLDDGDMLLKNDELQISDDVHNIPKIDAAQFIIDKLNKRDLAENKVLSMIEDIMNTRTPHRDLETPSSIPEFINMQKEFPIISKYTTTLVDKIKTREEEIGDYSATILMEIINSFNIDDLSPKLKRVLISRIKGVGITNSI